MNVTEELVTIGAQSPLRIVERDEHLLLSPPYPPKLKTRQWPVREPLSVVHYDQEFRAQPFAPPRGVYENDQIRVEWQTMNSRQPFYHRNCDVDELSYQIAGERTLMTELGVIEFQPGEFSRIPRGVAHDNYGRCESHLLFYLPAPVAEARSGRAGVGAGVPALPGLGAERDQRGHHPVHGHPGA